jgi:hypothetical protein
MKFGLVTTAALSAALLLAACAKNIDTEDAVKQAVLKDISSKVDVSAMDINVDSVSFRDKEADAQMSFRPKGNAASAGIVMKYTLKREGDLWKISTRNMESRHDETDKGGAAGNGVGNGATLPPGHPTTMSGQQLPPGHPTVNPATK